MDIMTGALTNKLCVGGQQQHCRARAPCMRCSLTLQRWQVEDETLRAHRIILTARSAVFNALLNTPMREGTEGVVQLQDIRAPVFRALLHFVYTDSLPAVSPSPAFLSNVYPKLDKYEKSCNCINCVSVQRFAMCARACRRALSTPAAPACTALVSVSCLLHLPRYCAHTAHAPLVIPCMHSPPDILLRLHLLHSSLCALTLPPADD